MSQERRISDTFSATNEVKNENYEGDHEQNVNEAAGDVESKSTAPKQQEKNGNN